MKTNRKTSADDRQSDDGVEITIPIMASLEQEKHKKVESNYD